MAELREPSTTEREVHELTHLAPQQWCDHNVKGRGVEHPHKRVTRNQHSQLLRSISVPSRPLEACLEWWQTRCLVLVDVDTGYLKAVHVCLGQDIY